MEKKRRPRIIKPNSEFSTERTKPETKEEQPEREPVDPKPKQEGDKKDVERPQPPSLERREDSDNESGERKPWQDRERKPYDSDRPQRPFDPDRPRKPYDPDRPQRPYDPDRQQRPYERREGGGGFGGGERKPWQDRERKPYDPDRKPYDPDRPRKPYDPDRPQRPFERREGGGGFGGGERKPWQDRERKPYDPDRKPYDPDRPQRPYDPDRPRRPYDPDRPQRPYERREGGGGGFGGRDQRGGGFKKPFGKKPFRKKEEFVVERKPKPGLPSGEGMPLNKYLAHCGVASRRKAVDYITENKVSVNGEVKTEPYYRVQPGDVILCDGQLMKIQERLVYVLLNKPKGVITTTEDEHGRATVLDIVDPHFPERLYPVGRLDRDTTGLLLITNDGDLAQKLAHPSHQIKKHYRIGLDRPLSQADFDRLEKGIELDDGPAPVNWIRFSEDHPERDVVELEVVIGRNRIVRRMFESLGYRVRKLDRFYYAGLTKRELPRGSYRELTQREVILLKHFSGNPPTPKRGAEEEEQQPDTDQEA